jgi:uncharacterized protein
MPTELAASMADAYACDLVASIAAIDPVTYEACRAGTPGAAGNPFLSQSFLRLLEDTGCVGGDTGWTPCHLRLRKGERTVGLAPLYLKAHSFGEFIMDHGWARAFERAGGRYYPKLFACPPFSPVPGPRFLLAQDAGPRAACLMASALQDIVRRNGLSGVHIAFMDEVQCHALMADADGTTGSGRWLHRLGVQYHWHNHGYRCFDDFLAALASRKRKAVRKEREAVRASGLTVQTLTGAALREEHMVAFHHLYNATFDRKWGAPYLNEAFFKGLVERMPDATVLVMGRDGQRWVGGALNFLGDDALYGRNWGSAGDVPFLHFEACYYRAIDLAIDLGLKRVEAGVQGEHKIQRGYLPTLTHSLHDFAHPGLSHAVTGFLEQERAAVMTLADELMQQSPYRQEGGHDER